MSEAISTERTRPDHAAETPLSSSPHAKLSQRFPNAWLNLVAAATAGMSAGPRVTTAAVPTEVTAATRIPTRMTTAEVPTRGVTTSVASV